MGVPLAGKPRLVRVPQATGHGDARTREGDVFLLDASRLGSVRIEAERRLATVGSGDRWGAVGGEAYRHGLVGRSGTATAVGSAGLTFGAGAGWFPDIPADHRLSEAGHLRSKIVVTVGGDS